MSFTPENFCQQIQGLLDHPCKVCASMKPEGNDDGEDDYAIRSAGTKGVQLRDFKRPLIQQHVDNTVHSIDTSEVTERPFRHGTRRKKI